MDVNLKGRDKEADNRQGEGRSIPVRTPQGRPEDLCEWSGSQGRGAGSDEAARREREACFQTMADFAHDMEYWIDPDGRVLYVSPSCQRITGYTAEEIVREPALLETMVHPEDRAAFVSHLVSERCVPETDSQEYRIITKDGQVRWIGHRCQPVTDPDGRCRGRRASNRDITTRKQTEENLVESERRYRELIETTNSIILRWDRQGVIRFINERGAKLLGYQPQELIGRDVMTLVPDVETTGRSLSSLARDILDHPENYVSNPNENITKDGSRLLIAWTNKAITDENGTVQEILAVGNDITAMKKAEAEIDRACQQHQLALKAAGMGWWHFDPITRIARLDDGFGDIFGLADRERPVDEILAQSIHPDDVSDLWAKVEAALDPVDPQPFMAEYRINRPDGALRWIEAHGMASFEGTGQNRRAVSLVGTVLDVTERREAADALRDSEQLLRMAQAAGQVGSFDWDLVSGEAHCSQEYFHVMGRPVRPDGIVTHVEWQSWIHPDDRDSLLAHLQASLEGTVEASGEYRMLGEDGQIRWIFYRGQLIRNEEGNPVRMVGTAQDITERKAAEAALRWSDRRHEVLAHTAADLLQSNDPQGLIEGLCRQVMSLLDCELFFNFLVDEDAGRLQLNAYAGIPALEARKIEWLDYGIAVCGCAARDRRRIIAEDIQNTIDPSTELVKSYGCEAYCCHPLIIQDRLIGTLSFGTRSRRRFAPEQIEVMKAVADLVAIAMYRIQTETSLRQSEQRLRTALDGGRMGRWEWDIGDDASFWSPRIYEFLGLSLSVTPKNSRFFDHVYEPDREKLKRIIAKAVSGGVSCEAEFRVCNGLEPYPEIMWLAMRGQVICDETGRATRMISVLFDITRSKQMEFELRRLNERLTEEVQAQTEELQDSVKRLRDEVDQRTQVQDQLHRSSRLLEAFFEHTITPLVFLDRDFNFLRVNDAYAQAAGKSCEYFVGKNHFALYPHEENEAIFRRVVRTKQPYRTFAKPFTYPDDPEGRVTYWNWQVTPLLDERGEVETLVFGLEDVTERQEAVRELERRARQLQQLTLELSQAEARERKRLAQILHDDLQQQLAGAKFHMSLLARRVKEDPETYAMATQMDGMIKDAIEKARTLSHELSPAVLYENDLAEVFHWLAKDMRSKHGLMVHVVGDGVTLTSDPLKPFLYQAGQELLFNIVKHAKVREARLRLRRLGRHVCLAVSDRGCGFEPSLLDNVAGFGLLSIRERVRLLGGRMKIGSTPGAGSRLTIAVPDEPTPEAIPGAEPAGRHTDVKVPRRTKRLSDTSRRVFRVVVADDHHIVREGLAAVLAEEPDMELVGQAANGREAIDIVRRLRPDVVIMDVLMPLISGSEATRQIKAHVPETRVIALSMFTEADMAQKMREVGAETYLLKTDSSEKLLAAIRDRANIEGIDPDHLP